MKTHWEELVNNSLAKMVKRSYLKNSKNKKNVLEQIKIV